MIDRRTLILSGATAPMTVAVSPDALAETPPEAPRMEFLLQARFEVGPRQPLGPLAGGERSVIPLLGGVFEGPRLRGAILPGASRHLDRPHGEFYAEALYDLRTDDGVVIAVKERALVDASDRGRPHGFSAAELTAPDGPYAWLNRRIVVGVLGADPRTHTVGLRLYTLA